MKVKKYKDTEYFEIKHPNPFPITVGLTKNCNSNQGELHFRGLANATIWMREASSKRVRVYAKILNKIADILED